MLSGPFVTSMNFLYLVRCILLWQLQHSSSVCSKKLKEPEIRLGQTVLDISASYKPVRDSYKQ